MSWFCSPSLPARAAVAAAAAEWRAGLGERRAAVRARKEAASQAKVTSSHEVSVAGRPTGGHTCVGWDSWGWE